MQAQHTFPRTWTLFDQRGEQSLLELDEWAKAGGLVAGIYCIYALENELRVLRAAKRAENAGHENREYYLPAPRWAKVRTRSCTLLKNRAVWWLLLRIAPP